MKRFPCFMCKKRPARPLTAERDGQIYVNAQKVTMFCSVRCAANYGLLWGVPEIDLTMHFCSVTKNWEHCERADCTHCDEEEV